MFFLMCFGFAICFVHTVVLFWLFTEILLMGRKESNI